MSHRGVHQTFDLNGVSNETCTARNIFKPHHSFIENTIASMREALALGADMIELDIHPTTDGEFVVFHDWSLDCRTNGNGRVRDHSALQLKALDIGYGYTADNGQTFPFRGKFKGKMPLLSEALKTFPDAGFLINIKSRSTQEGRNLLTYLEAHNMSARTIVIFGHRNPINAINSQHTNFVTWSKQDSKKCVKAYVLTGWSGYVPKACRNTWVLVPENLRYIFWGWPNRLQARLGKFNSRAVLMGPYTKNRGNPAIDTLTQIESIPKEFEGVVWTNRIELIGPALEASQ